MTREPLDAESWRIFAQRVAYVPLDVRRAEDFQRLAQRLQQGEPAEAAATRVYYLSTAPTLYPQAVAQLGAAGLADEQSRPSANRRREAVWQRPEPPLVN